jgi:hypothetical protein
MQLFSKLLCLHGGQSVKYAIGRLGGGCNPYSRETMGEIDAMSRLEAQADSLTAFPTLTPLTYYNLESPSVRTLFPRIFLDVASLISDISFPSRFHSPRTSQECSAAPGTVCREWPVRPHPVFSPKSSGVGWQWHPAIDETYLRDGYSTMDDIR